MNFFKSTIIVLISVCIFSFYGLETNASKSFSGLETQIHSGSDMYKIKKIQLVLSEFGLYSGIIDGKFKSIEKSLLDYQKKAGLIINNWDYGAGYFGVKTLKSLEKDFPNNFKEVSERYLKMEVPLINTRYFYVTAYYSAIPGQKRYSYSSKLKRYRNYYEAITMQGKGTNGASGKGVHVGMLAAPRNYKFGTKIEFEGLGVGIVEDRGQAIVNAGERNFKFDRIDIWMGYGDEGRLRAEKWGVRKIRGKIVPNTRELTIEFDESSISMYSNLKVNAVKPKKENVIKLQKLLTKVDIYKGVIDGQFSSIKDVLIKYQIDNNIIKSKKSEEAGYFGKLTYAALREEYGGGELKVNDNELDEDVLLAISFKKELDGLSDKITSILNKKYGKNTIKSIKYRNNLRKIILNQSKKTKSELRKRKLIYLKSII